MVLLFTDLKSSTKLDSLNIELHKLHLAVDSLQKDVIKDKINTDYFHDILSTQFGGFALLVSIILAVIGFISWGSIIIPFKRKTEQIKAELNTQINSQAAVFKEFENIQNNLAAKVHIALSHLAKQTNDPESACGWNIDAAISFLKIKMNEKAIEQLEDIIDILRTEKIDPDCLKENMDKFKDCINILKKFEVGEVTNLLKDIEGLYYPILYSKKNN